jgi:L-arabonate dehydrase
MTNWRAGWSPPEMSVTRGYQRLYLDHVQQANLGADLDFLVGASGHDVPRDNR